MANIKIIDDDVELAQNMATFLRDEGHTVTLRDEVDGAVEDLAENKPDLLILDVMFPEKPAGGFELARQIRTQRTLQDLPIIMLTGVNQEFPMDFSAGDIDDDWMPVQDFMEKPVDFQKLKQKANELLGA